MTAADLPSPLARKPALVLAVVAAGCLVALAVTLVPWDWVPGGALRPLPASDLFTPAEIARAEEYSSLRRYLGWASLAVSLLVTLALGLSPLGARLLRTLTGRLRWWLAVPAGVLALLLVGRLVTLPFALLIRDENLDYGLTRQRIGGWSVDYLKALLVSWVFTSILMLVLVGFARRSPRFWFAWVAAVALVLTAAGSFIYPCWSSRSSTSSHRCRRGRSGRRSSRWPRGKGCTIDDVLVADASRRTTTVNAYVSGFGGTRRVVVYDTLLSRLTQEPGARR